MKFSRINKTPFIRITSGQTQYEVFNSFDQLTTALRSQLHLCNRGWTRGLLYRDYNFVISNNEDINIIGAALSTVKTGKFTLHISDTSSSINLTFEATFYSKRFWIAFPTRFQEICDLLIVNTIHGQ